MTAMKRDEGGIDFCTYDKQQLLAKDSWIQWSALCPQHMRIQQTFMAHSKIDFHFETFKLNHPSYDGFIQNKANLLFWSFPIVAVYQTATLSIELINNDPKGTIFLGDNTHTTTHTLTD